MKAVFFVFALLLFNTLAMARCGSSDLSVWPSNGYARSNNLFLIQGYAISQKVIKGLNSQFPIYLECGLEKIRLKVRETLVGGYNVTQALLEPETALTPGQTYTLHIDHLPNPEDLGNYNSKKDEKEDYEYFILPEKDETPPILVEEPNFRETYFQTYGCGPGMGATFSSSASDASLILVKTSVKCVKTGEIMSYYLIGGEDLDVGHDMCSGAFRFDEADGDDYEAEFSFMDLCGNKNDWKGEPIAFKRPTPKDE